MCGLRELHCEHDVLTGILDRLDAAVAPLALGLAPDAVQLTELTTILQAIVSFDECHCARTEEAVLPALKQRQVDLAGNPLSMVCFEHMRQRVLINKMRRRLTRLNSNAMCRDQFATIARAYSSQMRAHMAIIDNQLLQLDHKVLSSEDTHWIDDVMERYDQEHGHDGIAEVIALASRNRF